MERRLTDIQWAVICALRAEPKYRFTGEEATWAKNMSRAGLLKKIRGQGRYAVTAIGTKRFETGR